MSRLDERKVWGQRQGRMEAVAETPYVLPDDPRLENVAAARKQKAENGRKHYQTDFAQARDIQRIAHQAVLDLEGKLSLSPDDESRARVAQALKAAVSAWDIARDAARIARNRPLPGSLRPEAKPKKQKPVHQTFSEQPSGPSAPIDKPIA